MHGIVYQRYIGFSTVHVRYCLTACIIEGKGRSGSEAVFNRRGSLLVSLTPGPVVPWFLVIRRSLSGLVSSAYGDEICSAD